MCHFSTCPIQASLKPVPGLPARSLHERLSEEVPRERSQKEGLLVSIGESNWILLRFCRKKRRSFFSPSATTIPMMDNAWKIRHAFLTKILRSEILETMSLLFNSSSNMTRWQQILICCRSGSHSSGVIPRL